MSQKGLDFSLVKKPHAKVKYTNGQLAELHQCWDDPVYFIKKYIKIQHPTKGAIPFECYPYQEKLVHTYHNYVSVCALMPRQSGKSTTAAAYLLWYASFIPDSTILIVSNKFRAASEIMQRIRYAYEELPDFLRPGVTAYNKQSIEFDNGSRIVATTTTPDSGRGMSISLLYVDELAFVKPRIAEEFWSAIAPTLATGGKCIITSTPNNDDDKFAEIWFNANKTQDEYGNETPTGIGNNGFKAFQSSLFEIPGRTEEWAAREKSKVGEEKFRREYLCEFISYEETLINPIALSIMEGCEPLVKTGEVRWYSQLIPNKTYLVALDPAMGTGGDFSAIQVYQMPEMIQIAEWKHNKTNIQSQIRLLYQILTNIEQTIKTNPLQRSQVELYWTVENNSVGEAALVVISDTGEDKFPGVFVHEPNKPGQQRQGRKGLNMNPRTKINACNKFKSLVETKRMIIKSKSLIREMKNFVAHGSSYKAKYGEHDDLISATLLCVRLMQFVLNWDDQGATNLRESIDQNDMVVEPLPIVF